MIAFVIFAAKHVLALALVMAAAAAAGTLIAGARGSLAIRSALGLAIWGQAFFFLALAGQLRLFPIVLLMVAVIAGGALRAGRPRLRWDAAGFFLPGLLFTLLFFVALYPPIAFDETLYHLPFVRAFAESGALRFLTTFRFPVFPQMHELLCVPLFLMAGDTATHLVSLAEVMLTAALLLEWGGRSGGLAAAIFLGSPIVVQLATVGYTDAALTLFVTAGFFCIDRGRIGHRAWFPLAGLSLGTACSVKYLGGYFAVAAFVIVVLYSRRAAVEFAASCAAAALPVTLWLIVNTHNPVFPFLPRLFGASAWAISFPPVGLEARLGRAARVLWDVTFARTRVNFEPPFTPFFILAVALVLIASLKSAGARCVTIVVAIYLVVFSFLPQDSRYLVPILPLISIAAASVVGERWPKAATTLAAFAIAPGLLYAVYVLALRGMPPATPAAREAMLTKRIPEYAALMRADRSLIYVHGAEQLKYYGRGELLGDVSGPYSYERILTGAETTASIARRLRSIGVRYFLVAKRVCAPPQPDGGMVLVYEDAAAQLWRVTYYESKPHRR